MNKRLNELRLDAGISQLKDDPRLVVIDREGNVIEPLVGLEKFAQLIVRECVIRAEREWIRNGLDTEHNKAITGVIKSIKEHFGVE
mgnify:CR=1 FL=1